jgi:chromosome segregation protein
MNDTKRIPSMLQWGATWLRVDFHLHTKADSKTFSYSGEDDRFVSDYVEGLKNAGIQIGVITNHNKFDADEFKALRKKARKEDICLLPGVELSTNDGRNGVHTLIIFDYSWIEDGKDYISQFISSMFPGKTPREFESANGRSDKNILQLVEELNKISRDYFLIFAHVEQDSGLWNEMGGGRLGDFADERYAAVRARTLGFQKVRTRDKRDKVQKWLGNWYPAEVEGSDCKSIGEIGKGNQCYVKVGSYTFEALKFALSSVRSDPNARVACQRPHISHSHVRSMAFYGGTLDGSTIRFSPELNTLIGIRGSGKSSVLEVLRYALDIPFGEHSGDTKYKEHLVGYTMGSGGKVEIDAVDRFGTAYTIRRVWKEPWAEVLCDGVVQPGVSIRETVLKKPIYFGQKDLSSTGEGFEKDLVEKLLGSKLDGVRREIDLQKQQVLEAIAAMTRLTSARDQLDEQKKIKQDTNHRLQIYRVYGIEERLQKRLDFDNDERVMKKGIRLTDAFISDLENLLARHEDDIRNMTGYASTHNAQLFETWFTHFNRFINALDSLKNNGLSQLTASSAELGNCLSLLQQNRKKMVEEFAEIERRLATELKQTGTPNISSDEFLSLKKKLAAANQLIDMFEKQSDQEIASREVLDAALKKLNTLWQREFQLIKEELDKVGRQGNAITIECDHKGDKDAYFSYMSNMFKGSNIRGTTFQKLTEKYTDFIQIFQDMPNGTPDFGSNPHVFINMFNEHLASLLPYQVPNRYVIKYRGKELQHHSLGQRASALILFILSQKENDVIIVDQPEDDLDNQTIYEDVIKLVRQIKSSVQFIFATHNPNIPVLGDADQVHACSFADDRISIESGSIDDPDTQKNIVNIMEGGEEAFLRRKEIYQIWKP